MTDRCSFILMGNLEYVLLEYGFTNSYFLSLSKGNIDRPPCVAIIFFPLEIRSSIPAGLDELPTVCNKAYFPEDLSTIWTRAVPLLFEQKPCQDSKP